MKIMTLTKKDLKEMFGEQEKRFDAKLDGVKEMFGEQEKRFDAKLDGVKEMFGEQEKRFDAKFKAQREEVKEMFEDQKKKFDAKFETQREEMKEMFEAQEKRLEENFEDRLGGQTELLLDVIQTKFEEAESHAGALFERMKDDVKVIAEMLGHNTQKIEEVKSLAVQNAEDISFMRVDISIIHRELKSKLDRSEFIAWKKAYAR